MCAAVISCVRRSHIMCALQPYHVCAVQLRSWSSWLSFFGSEQLAMFCSDAAFGVPHLSVCKRARSFWATHAEASLSLTKGVVMNTHAPPWLRLPQRRAHGAREPLRRRRRRGSSQTGGASGLAGIFFRPGLGKSPGPEIWARRGLGKSGRAGILGSVSPAARQVLCRPVQQ
eukprot:gene15998-biopygen17222